MLALNLTGQFEASPFMVVGSNDTGGISTSHGGMVLIVFNDERISRLQHFVLEQVGYRVVCAGTGAELGDIAHTTPSLVILDAMLRQMDGFTTCRKIRECSQVPITMVTAMDRDIDKVRGLEMGPGTISLSLSQPTN